MGKSYIVALYDTENGGPARAFECRLMDKKRRFAVRYGSTCGFVTRTERGMACHQRTVHGFIAQGNLLPASEGTPHLSDVTPIPGGSKIEP